ncbi:MAG: hypothetical protein ACRC7N_17040 [Clostridium sp.]
MCTNDILNVCQSNYDYFLDKTNVIGVGLGVKEVQGVETPEECIKILVTKKLPINQLASTDIVPAKYNNLSNNHVLAGDNTLPINSPILQPGLYDGGNPRTDVIAKLSKFVPIQYLSAFSFPVNYVDCAIAQVTIPSFVSPSIYGIGNIRGINLKPNLGLSVQKAGRTSAYTTGKILALGVTMQAGYSGGKTALFVNQIVTTSMASAGDSGSLVLDNNNYAVGLLFQGQHLLQF